jgi:ABC-type sugar transport system substrate-binding protein
MEAHRTQKRTRRVIAGRKLGLWATLAAALVIAGSLVIVTGAGAGAKKTSKAGAKIRIAVVLHLRVPSLLQFCYGAESAGKQFGFDVDCVGPQKINTLQQQQIVNSEVNNRGVQGIAPLLIGAESWRRTFAALQKRGIRIVDTGIQTGKFMGDATPLLVAPRDFRTGLAAGNLIIDHLPSNPTGEVIVAPGVIGLKLCEDRYKGVVAAFKQKAPKVKILRLNAADDDVKGPIDWQALINAHPNALAFIGDCASTAPAILGKIHRETHAKWLATGSELDPRTPGYIKSGDVVGVTSASFWVEGYVAGRVLYEQIANKKYLNYKGWIDSGTQVVTKQNVDGVINAFKSKANLAKYYAARVAKIFANLKAVLGPY